MLTLYIYNVTATHVTLCVHQMDLSVPRAKSRGTGSYDYSVFAV